MAASCLGIYKCPPITEKQHSALSKIKKDICFTLDTNTISFLREKVPVYTILTESIENKCWIQIFKKEFGKKEIERILIITPDGEFKVCGKNGEELNEKYTSYVFNDNARHIFENILNARIPRYVNFPAQEGAPIFTHHPEENTHCDLIILTRKTHEPIYYKPLDQAHLPVITHKIEYLLTINRDAQLTLLLNIQGTTLKKTAATYTILLKHIEQDLQLAAYHIPEVLLRAYFVDNIFPYLQSNSPKCIPRSRL